MIAVISTVFSRKETITKTVTGDISKGSGGYSQQQEEPVEVEEQILVFQVNSSFIDIAEFYRNPKVLLVLAVFFLLSNPCVSFSLAKPPLWAVILC